MYITINKLHFLLWHSFSVHLVFLLKRYRQPLQYALNVRAGQQDLRDRSVQMLVEWGSRAPGLPSAQRQARLGGAGLPVPQRARGAPLTPPPVFPPRTPPGQWGARRQQMSGGVLLLHTHCGPVAVHVLWGKRGVATAQASLQSARETLTCVTNSNSGCHLLRTYAGLIS